MLKATNIIWDTDDECDETIFLPSVLEIPEGMEDEEEISDYISNLTGFCHYGFELEEVAG